MKPLIAMLLLLAAPFLAPAQDTRFTMSQAMELNIPTQEGFGYQILESDLSGLWRSVGPQFLGTGSLVNQRLAAGRPAQFYRAESFPVRNLNSIVEEIRSRKGVPALACAVVKGDRIIAIGASGSRKHGIQSPVTIADKWHIGSLTKSMTATLAAILVEEGRLQWTTTLGAIFPEIPMAREWRDATLEQLTSNRGGAPNSVTTAMWSDFWNFNGSPREARRHMARRVLGELPPTSTPGTRYEYSNFGFALAGHMLETVTGRAWEDLITEKLFHPLGMSGIGFGAPGTPRYLDQPLGHDTSMTPVELGLSADNPPAIGPAGTAHCSLLDMASYMMFQLRAHKADTELLSNATAAKLHRAYANNSNYAHGWINASRSWAGAEPALNHTGTNTKWYANLWLAPGRDFGMITFCNLGGDTAFAATDEVSARMIQEFLR